jgi:glycosyltransferase involved in cell wall biosynthesis
LNTPLVSIVVPVFNCGRFLRECLDSILAQTYSHTEILVMDNASTDDTRQIAASYGKQIQVFRQPLNRGIFGNVNDGIEKSRGEYIAVYHGDDIYEPTIVERQVAFLQNFHEAGAVFCMDTFIDAESRIYEKLNVVPELRGERPLEYERIFNALLTYKNAFLVCPSSMVRASVYRQVGGYNQQEWRVSADLEMWLRINRRYPIGILEDQLLRYRHGHGNSCQRYEHLRTDEERFFTIMDRFLGEGDQELATPDSQAAYQAHRAWDRMKRAINHYILGQRTEAIGLLKQVRSRHILGSPQVQRIRLFVLLWGLRVVARLPRSRLIADLFYRRWNTKRIPFVNSGNGER